MSNQRFVQKAFGSEKLHHLDLESRILVRVLVFGRIQVGLIVGRPDFQPFFFFSISAKLTLFLTLIHQIQSPKIPNSHSPSSLPSLPRLSSPPPSLLFTMLSLPSTLILPHFLILNLLLLLSLLFTCSSPFIFLLSFPSLLFPMPPPPHHYHLRPDFPGTTTSLQFTSFFSHHFFPHPYCLSSRCSTTAVAVVESVRDNHRTIILKLNKNPISALQQ